MKKRQKKKELFSDVLWSVNKPLQVPCVCSNRFWGVCHEQGPDRPQPPSPPGLQPTQTWREIHSSPRTSRQSTHTHAFCQVIQECATLIKLSCLWTAMYCNIAIGTLVPLYWSLTTLFLYALKSPKRILFLLFQISFIVDFYELPKNVFCW